MKNIILITLISLLIPVSLQSQYLWSEITYHYQTGSVPPPYHFSYYLNINSDGTGKLVYHPSYSDSSWIYDINLTSSQINQLDSAIQASNLMNEDVPELPKNKHPIGGSLQNVQITIKPDDKNQAGKSITTPYFPQPEYKEKLVNLYDLIKSLIPADKWEDIEVRKSEKNK